MVNLVPAFAYLFCLALPAAFTQPWVLFSRALYIICGLLVYGLFLCENLLGEKPFIATFAVHDLPKTYSHFCLSFIDELKRDPDHATAAATTKRPVPHAAAQLSDGLAHAQRGRGPAALPPRSPPVPSSLTATTATDQQPIKQQYAAAATDNVLLVHGER